MGRVFFVETVALQTARRHPNIELPFSSSLYSLIDASYILTHEHYFVLNTTVLMRNIQLSYKNCNILFIFILLCNTYAILCYLLYSFHSR